MWWSRRLLLVAALAGCGFTPVYGPGGEALALRGAVLATEPDTDLQFSFVQRIEERLGLPEAPRYALRYDFDIEDEGLAIDGSNNITRFNIEGELTWALTTLGSDVPLLTGVETSFTAYSATGSTISTQESERDARRRLAIILADRVVTRLLAENGL
ncbi:MAG: LPS assembly lipoprotein LptE [Pseudomonadota bacterium]